MRAPVVFDYDDLPWHKAPLPKRRHKCFSQTLGWLDGRCIQRCPCGGISDTFGQFWSFKNERRDALPRRWWQRGKRNA